ncbi:AFP homolog 2-like [Sesamum indicum]|uniref:Ninja-family protein n=1 Tax=Sesamum indicum TaxID=4182 RepID=A0A6I9TX53_SESIN|nr:AFP homolog 2-like [Sesamum indicum]
MEVLKVSMEKEEEKGDEFELSLELSIGGSYGKSEDLRGKTSEENVNNCGGISSRSDFSCGVGNENGYECVDLQRRREIQALRRQEARKKREEKLKKSRVVNGVGFVEDKLLFEAQKFQGRVQDREIRERDGFQEELARKRDKNYGTHNEVVANGLSLSLFTHDNKIHRERDCLNPKVQHMPPGNGFVYPCVPPFLADCDSEHSNGMSDRGNMRTTTTMSNGSMERSSSAVSDYQSTSQKGGGSNSDAGSNSSPLFSRANLSISTNASHHLESNGSSSQTEQDRILAGVPDHHAKVASSRNPQPSWSKFTGNNHTNNACSSSEKETSGCPVDKPPKLPNENLTAACLARMPCVSATGNGPNGTTVTGFLYKYTKTEVSIMCVCHGSSFSPAEFVEHAGCVGVSHPLRHITIVPSAFR